MPIRANRWRRGCNARGDLRLIDTHDRQRDTPFRYWRCGRRHGRFITFFDFLREGIRAAALARASDGVARAGRLSPAPTAARPLTSTSSACGIAGRSLSMLDFGQVQRMLTTLRDAEDQARREGATGQPRRGSLHLALARERRHVEAFFKQVEQTPDWSHWSGGSGLVQAGVSAIVGLLRYAALTLGPEFHGEPCARFANLRRARTKKKKKKKKKRDFLLWIARHVRRRGGGGPETAEPARSGGEPAAMLTRRAREDVASDRWASSSRLVLSHRRHFASVRAGSSAPGISSSSKSADTWPPRGNANRLPSRSERTAPSPAISIVITNGARACGSGSRPRGGGPRKRMSIARTRCVPPGARRTWRRGTARS